AAFAGARSQALPQALASLLGCPPPSAASRDAPGARGAAQNSKAPHPCRSHRTHRASRLPAGSDLATARANDDALIGRGPRRELHGPRVFPRALPGAALAKPAAIGIVR